MKAPGAMKTQKAGRRIPKKGLLGVLIGALVLLALGKVGLDLYESYMLKKADNQKAQEEATRAQTQKTGRDSVEPSLNFPNLMEELKKERRYLAIREAEIAKKEAFVQGLEQRLQAKASELVALERRLYALSLQAEKARDERVKALVGVYENMEPEQAAQAIEGMDTNLAIELFLRMRKREAGRILGAMDPQRASEISESLAKFQQVSTQDGSLP